jgi:Spy/CpxP family protein refolding chaperone
MKNQNLITPMLVVALLIISSISYGQNRRFNNRDNEPSNVNTYAEEGASQGYCSNIPNLTDEQQSALNKLRTNHLKKANLMRAQIQEKRAQLNTLRLSEKPDMDKINRTIDEVAELRADLMKEREAHLQAVKSQLNDDQKAWFDSRPGRGKGFGQNRGFGRQGACMFDQEGQRPDGGRRYRQFR